MPINCLVRRTASLTTGINARLLAMGLVFSGLVWGCSPNAKPRSKAAGNPAATPTDRSGAEPGGTAGSTITDAGTMIEAFIAKPIQDGLAKFKAENGRDPNDLNEVMEKVVRAYGIRLPALPIGKAFAYDAEKPALKVVDAAAESQQ